MRQYARIKAEHADKILFFRMGDFYEMFFEDALTASKLLDITLTSREKGPGAVPMAGVPWHAAEGYIAKLLAAGHKVAVCDQMEPPSKGKKLVRREVTRVITPGTMIGEDLLDAGRNNYLCALAPARDSTGLAALDLSTGDFTCGEFAPGALADELARLAPAEVLAPRGSRGEFAAALDTVLSNRSVLSAGPPADGAALDPRALLERLTREVKAGSYSALDTFTELKAAWPRRAMKQLSGLERALTAFESEKALELIAALEKQLDGGRS